MKKAVIAGLVVGISVALYGCGGGGGSSTTTSSSSTTYNGAGSRWELIVNNDATCEIHEKDSNLNLNADCTTLSSGFTKITVNSVTNSSTIKSGDVTYGFELPGFMLPFVAFGENKLIPTVVGGKCPTGGINHNLIVSYAEGNSPTNNFDGWGTYGYWQSSGTSLHVQVYDRNNNSTNTMDITNYASQMSCSKGTTYMTDSTATTTAYWTDGGGLIWNQASATDDRVENDFMIPVETGLTDLTLGGADGNYIGYKITGNGQPSIGYTNTAVKATMSGDTLTITPVDPATGTATGAGDDTVTLSNNVNDGLFNGSLLTSAGSEGIGCAYDLNAHNSGKNVIVCGGMNPDGSLQKLYSLILVSK